MERCSSGKAVPLNQASFVKIPITLAPFCTGLRNSSGNTDSKQIEAPISTFCVSALSLTTNTFGSRNRPSGRFGASVLSLTINTGKRFTVFPCAKGSNWMKSGIKSGRRCANGTVLTKRNEMHLRIRAVYFAICGYRKHAVVHRFSALISAFGELADRCVRFSPARCTHKYRERCLTEHSEKTFRSISATHLSMLGSELRFRAIQLSQAPLGSLCMSS